MAIRATVVGACLALLASACGDDSGDGEGDPNAGGMDGSVPTSPPPSGGSPAPTGTTDAATPPAPPLPPPPAPVDAGPISITCDGDPDADAGATVVCEAPAGGFLMPCCPEGGGCGNMTPISDQCVPVGGEGGLDPSCGDVVVTTDVAGDITLPGCCTPGGECGGLGTTSGCVPRDMLLGDPTPQSCTYDPANDCVGFREMSGCDGAEDCSGDQVCAGVYQGAYESFSCVDDVAALDTAEAANGGAVSEACHGADDACQVDGFSCLVNTDLLPPFYARCRDTGEAPTTATPAVAGEINCGSGSCDAATEKCCVPMNAAGYKTDDVYCAPLDATCTCFGAAGGGDTDGGT